MVKTGYQRLLPALTFGKETERTVRKSDVGPCLMVTNVMRIKPVGLEAERQRPQKPSSKSRSRRPKLYIPEDFWAEEENDKDKRWGNQTGKINRHLNNCRPVKQSC